MSDNVNPPRPGSQDWDWLYGEEPNSDQTQMFPEQNAPPAGTPPLHPPTQALPTTPRLDPTPPPPRRVAPTPGLPKLPKVPRPRPVRWLRRTMMFGPILLLAWVSYLVFVPYQAMGSIERVDAFSKSSPDDQPGTNYLLVGSDSRAGLSAAERKELGTGSASGQRTDTIMILHVGSGPNLLTSLPRDSLVEVPGYGRTKINGAFSYGGPKLLMKTVEQATGLHIDHYVEIGFGGFVGVIDAVGGIEICPKENMNDPKAKLKIKKGCQEADGPLALGYARSRYTSSLGDIDRAQRQREVVTAVGREVVNWKTVVNPIRYWKVNHAAAESVRLSEDTGPIDMARFARGMTNVSGEDGKTCAVPLANLSVEWDQARAKEFFKLIAEDKIDDMPKSLCTPSGFPKGKP